MCTCRARPGKNPHSTKRFGCSNMWVQLSNWVVSFEKFNDEVELLSECVMINMIRVYFLKFTLTVIVKIQSINVVCIWEHFNAFMCSWSIKYNCCDGIPDQSCTTVSDITVATTCNFTGPVECIQVKPLLATSLCHSVAFHCPTLHFNMHFCMLWQFNIQFSIHQAILLHK